MTRSLLLGVAVVLMAWSPALHAGAPCCDGCGCQPCTRKVCRLVCEMKDVTKNVYDCKCEDFCLPAPSTRCKAPCTCPGKCCKDHTIWKPNCGCVRTRTVLIVKKETKKVPSYKCVVEEVAQCGHCAKKTSYPESANAADALAMVKDAGVEQVIGADDLPGSNRATEPAMPTDNVASRGTLERMFSRK